MKKTCSKIIKLSLSAALILSVASCDDNEPDNSVTVDLARERIEYDGQGVWAEYLNPDQGAVVCQGVSFSHAATVSSWGAFWSGFCPSRSTDVADYSSGNWLDHQWTAVGGGGVDGQGTPYLVGYWNSSEGENPGEAASLLIKMADGTPFKAYSVFVNNTTYSYYAMLNGTAYSKTFGAGDWQKLVFFGVTTSGELAGKVECYLADYRSSDESARRMTDDWEMVNLEPLNALGALSYIYVQMESSDSGQWGMNTPAYFALDRLKVIPGA